MKMYFHKSSKSFTNINIATTDTNLITVLLNDAFLKSSIPIKYHVISMADAKINILCIK
ncbi:hypothetical protein D3C73_1604460 [compost metagenome]